MAKYGLRSDGKARDPWKNNADARALGYRSTTDFRVKRGEARGLSRSAAVGHAKRGEPTARDLQRVRQPNKIDAMSLTAKRRAALANSRARMGDREGYDDLAQQKRIQRITDEATLVAMATATEDEWIEQATIQVDRNPWYYH